MLHSRETGLRTSFLVMFKYLETTDVQSRTEKLVTYTKMYTLFQKPKTKKKKKEKVWTVRLFYLTLWSGVSGQTADVCGSDIIRTKRVFIKYVQLKFHPDIKLTVITPTITTRAENILVTISSSATSCIHFPFWEAERKIPVFPS